VRVEPAALTSFAREVLVAVGLTEEDAATAGSPPTGWCGFPSTSNGCGGV
jgi:hypothetical protein